MSLLTDQEFAIALGAYAESLEKIRLDADYVPGNENNKVISAYCDALAEVERLNALLAEAQRTLLELKPERSTEYRLIMWDWQERPDFEAISSAFTELSRGGTTYGYNVEDTGCDEYAVIISTVPLDQTGVQSVFEELRQRQGEDETVSPGAGLSGTAALDSTTESSAGLSTSDGSAKPLCSGCETLPLGHEGDCYL